MPAVLVLAHMDATWTACLTHFLQQIEDRSGSLASRRSYASVLTRFLSTLDNPADATRADVLQFLSSPSNSNRNKGSAVTASCKNARRSIISSFYRFASGYEIDGTPLFARPLPTLGLPHLKPAVAYHALNIDGLERLFAAIPTDTVKGLRDRALFLTYFWTARRRSELIDLRWHDIQPAIIEGRETHTYQYRAKGTSRTVRTAELPMPAYQAVMRYLEMSGRIGHLQPDSPIFVSVHPGQGYKDSRTNMPLNRDYANKQLKIYCRLAGLPHDISLHSLRHSSARARYEAGSDIRAIQQVLGHASLATTDTYLKILMPIGDTGATLLQERFQDL
jgi:site-specific recombinase XerD